jgi:hypothetical protein
MRYRPVSELAAPFEPCGPCRLHREVLLSAVCLLRAVTSFDQRAADEHIRLGECAAQWIDGNMPDAPVSFGLLRHLRHERAKDERKNRGSGPVLSA